MVTLGTVAYEHAFHERPHLVGAARSDPAAHRFEPDRETRAALRFVCVGREHEVPEDTLDHVRAILPAVSRGRRAAPQGYFPPACDSDIFRITSSRLKLAGFWRGGKSLKLANHLAANVCIGTMRNDR
jgi:hypothetical protein